MADNRPFNEGEFPGYAAAVARENLVRGAACLGGTETIAGLEVLPLTAFHVRRLSFAKSPFQAAVTAEQLCADEASHGWLLHHALLFLWIVSPLYQDGAKVSEPPVSGFRSQVSAFFGGGARLRRAQTKTARDKFNEAFAPVMKLRLVDLCREILGYIEEAYLDADAPDDTGDPSNYFSFEHAIAQELHSNYPRIWRVDFWNPACPPAQNPVLVPLKHVWQLRTCRAKAKGEPVANRSDQMIAAGLAELGKIARRRREYETELAAEKPAPGDYRTDHNFDYGVN